MVVVLVLVVYFGLGGWIWLFVGAVCCCYDL